MEGPDFDKLKAEADAAFREGRLDDAERGYTLACRACSGSSAKVWANRALTRLKLDRRAEAARDARRALRCDPKWAKAWVRLGDCTGDHAAYDQAIALGATEEERAGFEALPRARRLRRPGPSEYQPSPPGYFPEVFAFVTLAWQEKRFPRLREACLARELQDWMLKVRKEMDTQVRMIEQQISAAHLAQNMNDAFRDFAYMTPARLSALQCVLEGAVPQMHDLMDEMELLVLRGMSEMSLDKIRALPLLPRPAAEEESWQVSWQACPQACAETGLRLYHIAATVQPDPLGPGWGMGEEDTITALCPAAPDGSSSRTASGWRGTGQCRQRWWRAGGHRRTCCSRRMRSRSRRARAGGPRPTDATSRPRGACACAPAAGRCRRRASSSSGAGGAGWCTSVGPTVRKWRGRHTRRCAASPPRSTEGLWGGGVSAGHVAVALRCGTARKRARA
mmetsp:Transcript_5336/g.13530  ORF Transcript_5336/g.13530 Transcript_5336/m.13530 type:complete len:450 (+) Transcript_5336:103-1452(+)